MGTRPLKTIPSLQIKRIFATTLLILIYQISTAVAYRIGETVDLVIRKKCIRHGNGKLMEDEMLHRRFMPRFGLDTNVSIDHLKMASCGNTQLENGISFIRSMSFLFSQGSKIIPSVIIRKDDENVIHQMDHIKVLDKLSVTFLYSRSHGEILSILLTEEIYKGLSPNTLESYYPFQVEYIWVEEPGVDSQSGMVMMLFIIFASIVYILFSALHEYDNEEENGNNSTKKVIPKKQIVETSKPSIKSDFPGFVLNSDYPSEIYIGEQKKNSGKRQFSKKD